MKVGNLESWKFLLDDVAYSRCELTAAELRSLGLWAVARLSVSPSKRLQRRSCWRRANNSGHEVRATHAVRFKRICSRIFPLGRRPVYTTHGLKHNAQEAQANMKTEGAKTCDARCQLLRKQSLNVAMSVHSCVISFDIKDKFIALQSSFRPVSLVNMTRCRLRRTPHTQRRTYTAHTRTQFVGEQRSVEQTQYSR